MFMWQRGYVSKAAYPKFVMLAEVSTNTNLLLISHLLTLIINKTMGKEVNNSANIPVLLQGLYKTRTKLKERTKDSQEY